MDHLMIPPQLIQTLESGRDSVHHIRVLLNQRPGSTSSGHYHDHQGYFKGLDDHSMMALSALDTALSMLHTSEHTSLEDPQFGSSKSQDSAVDTPRKDRRGCYKRRRNMESKIVVTTELTDDGFAWRKYGQKIILNTTHPRNYFRCTHKLDQGCQATKQVQQISEKPTEYKIIYHGHHTCKLSLHKNPPPSIFNYSSDNNPDPSFYLSFETDTHTPSPDLFSSSMVKQEYGPIKEETTSEPSDHHQKQHHQYNSSSSPSSPDPTTTTPRSETSSADVYSMASPHDFDMGEDFYINIMHAESIDLDQILQGIRCG